VYRTSAYGEVPLGSMLHVRAIGLDGLWGESPVRLCKTSLQVMAAQETSQLNVMQNAGNPKIAMVHPGPLSASARQAITEDYMARHSGSENTGKPLVLAEGMRVERISSTLDDAGISAARRYSVEDVSRIYGVPTSYLSEHSTSAYGSMEWLTRMYLDACLSHWFAAWTADGGAAHGRRVGRDHAQRGARDAQSRAASRPRRARARAQHGRGRRLDKPR
jgi:HK97 family phage portal protein